MQFNGITLHGRALKIGHPNGYVVPMMTASTLKVPAELMEKLGLAACGALPPGASDNKRQRELYVGNLTVGPNPNPNPNPDPNPDQTGAVTAQMLKELFAVPLSTIPGHDPAIPPVRTRDAAPQPRVLEAATPCWRLQPRVLVAATVCVKGGGHVCTGGGHRVHWRRPPHAGARGPLRP